MRNGWYSGEVNPPGKSGANGSAERSPEGYKQAAIAVKDEQGFEKLHALMDAAFDDRDIEVLLSKVTRARLRIRDYEQVLKRGLLGREATTLYAALPVSDQGLTRERYLRLVEKVPVELRQRYFKAYAYY